MLWLVFLPRRREARPVVLLGPIEEGQAPGARLLLQLVEPGQIERFPRLASAGMGHGFPARLSPVLGFRHGSGLSLMALACPAPASMQFLAAIASKRRARARSSLGSGSKHGASHVGCLSPPIAPPAGLGSSVPALVTATIAAGNASGRALGSTVNRAANRRWTRSAGARRWKHWRIGPGRRCWTRPGRSAGPLTWRDVPPAWHSRQAGRTSAWTKTDIGNAEPLGSWHAPQCTGELRRPYTQRAHSNGHAGKVTPLIIAHSSQRWPLQSTTI